jgi:hypothetical protein
VMMRLIAESMATGTHGRARAAVRLGTRVSVAFIAVVASVLALPVVAHVAARLFPASRLGVITALVGGMIAARALTQVLGSAFRGFSDFARSALLGLAGGPILVAAGLALVRIASGHASLQLVAAITIAGWIPALAIAYLMLRRRVAALSDSAPADQSRVDTARYGRSSGRPSPSSQSAWPVTSSARSRSGSLDLVWPQAISRGSARP